MIPTPRLLFSFLTLAFAAGPTFAQNTWTLRNQNPTSANILWSLVEGSSGIVTVGTGGLILHSLDGKTWVQRNSGTTVWLVAVAFGNERYVAVGENGTILISTNAVTWTSVTPTGTTARLNNVLYAQGKFVAVGEGGTIVVSTDSGLTWKPTSSGVSNLWLRGLAYGNGVWLTSGQSGTPIYSTDGVTWTVSLGGGGDIEAIVYVSSTGATASDGSRVSNNFLSVGAGGVAVQIGINYSTERGYYFNNYSNGAGKPGTTARLRSLSIGNGVFIAAGEDGSVFTSKSYYGPWSKVTINTNRNLVGAGYALGCLMLVGDGETIFQSEPIFVSRLGNIATRGVASSGANAMIAGTVIQGLRPKQMLIRGIGPALAGFGVSGALADPVLSVFDSGGRLVSSNSGWGTNLNTSSIVTAALSSGAFALTPNSKDAALLLTLNPGNYTFQVSSASGGSGNSLVEAYDLDPIDATSPRAINIATRGQVGTGDNILIAGVNVQGQSARTLLIRGVGPTLGQFGVPGVLADPMVNVVASDGTVIATNDNWSDSTITNGRTVTADEVALAAGASGAFPLAPNSKDAALLITLLPGSYTIQVSGANHTTGVALVEAYDVARN